MKENIEKYINQDLSNPKYLFHGTSCELEKLEPRQSLDYKNKSNEDKAIFLTNWIINAAAYAFRSKLKEVNEYYSFSINNDAELPVMTFEVENLPDDLSGYIYVFEKNEEMIKDNKKFTTQYRCYNELIPQKIIKVYYKDFEKYFKRIERRSGKMFLKTPKLETERLILKKGSAEDFVKVYEYDFTKLRDICGEFEFVKNDPNFVATFASYSEETEDVYDWIIYLKETMEPIANVIADRYNKELNSLEFGNNKTKYNYVS